MSPLADPARRDAWRKVRRLLVVRLDNLGDLLMTTPAIAALRTDLPQARITLLASAAGAKLGPHLDDIDDLIVHDASWVAHAAPAAPEAERALLTQLARRAFDGAVIFTVCTQSALPAALLLRLAGIPLRLAHARENPYALLSDCVREPDLDLATARHEVRRQLDLVGHVGFRVGDERLRFALRPIDVRSLAQRLCRHDIDPRRPLVVLHPGASAASRRYPAERFGVAAQLIADAAPATLVFTGSSAEACFIDAARAQLAARSLSLAGELSLGELAALIARADLLVTNNSGPVHLAAALATPVVDLYALTNPQHTPWLVPARVLNQDVPCRNCLKSVCPQGHHACLLGVPPQAVAQAAIELMHGRVQCREIA
jgi:lipopolysaccharide heptosyltransferase II